jgi:hypothetical protein
MGDESSKPERLTGPLEVLLKTKHFNNVRFAKSSPTPAVCCYSEAGAPAPALPVRFSAENLEPSHV